MAGSSSKKRFFISLLMGAAIFGALAAGYVGTAAAWVILLEVLAFLAIAVAAGLACPSLADLPERDPEGKSSEQD